MHDVNASVAVDSLEATAGCGGLRSGQGSDDVERRLDVFVFGLNDQQVTSHGTGQSRFDGLSMIGHFRYFSTVRLFTSKRSRRAWNRAASSPVSVGGRIIFVQDDPVESRPQLLALPDNIRIAASVARPSTRSSAARSGSDKSTRHKAAGPAAGCTEIVDHHGHTTDLEQIEPPWTVVHIGAKCRRDSRIVAKDSSSAVPLIGSRSAVTSKVSFSTGLNEVCTQKRQGATRILG